MTIQLSFFLSPFLPHTLTHCRLWSLLAAECARVIPALDFDLRAASRRVLELPLPALASLDMDSRATYLAGFLSGDSTRSLRALGALIKHVEKDRFGAELDAAASFVTLTLAPAPEVMLVDLPALT